MNIFLWNNVGIVDCGASSHGLGRSCGAGVPFTLVVTKWRQGAIDDVWRELEQC